MNARFFLPLAAASLLAPGVLAQDATQNNGRPGSLLVFPMFDNQQGIFTFVTVTNSNDTPGSGAPNSPVVDAHFVYRNGVDCSVSPNTCCLETNNTKPLSPNDTITVLTKFDTGWTKGYLYVYAEATGTSSTPIKYDHLMGTMTVFDIANSDSFEVPPYVFKAGSAITQGNTTDLDGDGLRDLNGNEYEAVPDVHLVPRFIGQPDQVGPNSASELVLIPLTGGAQFTTLVNFLIYNDNEDVFSAQTTVQCWKRLYLNDLSGAFTNNFLVNSNDNPAEYIQLAGTTRGPAPQLETGWFKFEGQIANSSATSKDNPALLGMRIDRVYVPNSNIIAGASAALPYGKGSNPNGDLLPFGVLGDTTP